MATLYSMFSAKHSLFINKTLASMFLKHLHFRLLISWLKAEIDYLNFNIMTAGQQMLVILKFWVEAWRIAFAVSSTWLNNENMNGLGHVLRHDVLLRDILQGRMLGKCTTGRKRLQLISNTCYVWRNLLQVSNEVSWRQMSVKSFRDGSQLLLAMNQLSKQSKSSQTQLTLNWFHQLYYATY